MRGLYGLVCLFWLAGSAQAQRLQGSFALDSIEGRHRLGTQVFSFSGNRFTHLVAGCLAGDAQVDKGYFTYRRDTLTLRYDDWQQAASTFSSTSPTQPGPTIRLLLVDAAAKKPLRDIVLVDIRSRMCPKLNYGIDSANNIIISQLLSPNDTLSIKHVGYMPIEIPIRYLTGKTVTVLLAPKDYRRPGGTSEKYLLQLQTPSSFALHVLEPTIPWAYFYRRLPARQ